MRIQVGWNFRKGQGVPVIDMDTLIAPLDNIDVHSFLAPDNEYMGAAVTQVLMDQIGGEGLVVMTQGALGHTGAQAPAVSSTSSTNIRR
jgi:ribose transport system substrate-binding protein